MRQNQYHEKKKCGERGGRTSAAAVGTALVAVLATGLVAALATGLVLLIAAAFRVFERASTKSESVLLFVSWEAFLEGAFRRVHLRLVDDCAPSASSSGSSINTPGQKMSSRYLCDH